MKQSFRIKIGYEVSQFANMVRRKDEDVNVDVDLDIRYGHSSWRAGLLACGSNFLLTAGFPTNWFRTRLFTTATSLTSAIGAYKMQPKVRYNLVLIPCPSIHKASNRGKLWSSITTSKNINFSFQVSPPAAGNNNLELSVRRGGLR